jgi:hypothetical protein
MDKKTSDQGIILSVDEVFGTVQDRQIEISQKLGESKSQPLDRDKKSSAVDHIRWMNPSGRIK